MLVGFPISNAGKLLLQKSNLSGANPGTLYSHNYALWTTYDIHLTVCINMK